MRGVVPAVVTPFREDESVDYNAWQEHIEALIASGVHGLFVLGGQGEFFSLTEEEREVAARFCVQQAAGRVPVYANVGCVTTRESIRLAQHAETDGVDCLVAVTPYYIRPSAAELAEHFIDIASSVRIPVLAYSIPERTGVDLTPALLKQVAGECPNFAGLKDSSGDLDRIAEFRAAGLNVFMGRDHLVLEGLKRGCAGAVTACANVVPGAFVDLFRAFEAGDMDKAARLQSLVEPLRRAFSLGTFPAVVKEAMELAGVHAGPCRAPVGPLDAAARAQLRAVLEPLRAAGYIRKRRPVLRARAGRT